MSPTRVRIERHASLPSTSDLAIARAEAGAGPWCAVLAETQTAGRGRHGRRWMSPPGNLYFSVVLDPEALPAPGGFGLLSGLAVADAVAPLLPGTIALHLKWPNDLVADGRKLGGVLVEVGTRRDGTRWAVAGIGVNLVAHPDDADRPATSLAALGVVPPAPDDLAAAILDRLINWSTRAGADGFDIIVVEWQRRALPRGAPISVRLTAGPITGRFAGLDADGALLLAEESGQTRRIVTGEVFARG
ncbi:biotin--[acetyl-CoA-carboxylase] ligase [Elioraea sp.]|uniref:biotin--[acetyl-CoA-carboxylase] ligase n=1 Tax=Elioraea sp. TaxID=2185103 RepID=UPI003F71375C